MAEADLYQAKDTFTTNVKGEQIVVHKGDLVRKGHPVLKGRKALFEPAHDYVRFDVESATRAPGEKRKVGIRRTKPASSSGAKAGDQPKAKTDS